jgi:hypothetical protein
MRKFQMMMTSYRPFVPSPYLLSLAQDGNSDVCASSLAGTDGKELKPHSSNPLKRMECMVLPVSHLEVS